MEQKATVTFNGESGTLVIAGELLPDSPIVHHMLAALLDEKDPATASVETSIENNVINYKVTFKHTTDIVSAGKAAHDVAVAAANKGMTVEKYLEWKAEQDKTAAAVKAAQAKQDKAAKKAGDGEQTSAK